MVSERSLIRINGKMRAWPGLFGRILTCMTKVIAGVVASSIA